MNNDDIKFLTAEFQNAMNQVENDKFCIDMLQRKFAHSSRVLQNGIRIIEHDLPGLLKQPQLLKLCKQSLFFHDIGRFQETVQIHKSKTKNWREKLPDHGVLGAEILAQNTNYNDIRMVLAVRHHGHLIEDFYNDPDFQNLSAIDQSQAEIMIKLIRDADKLDLYYLQKNDDSIKKDVFFIKLTDEQKYGSISSEVLDCFLKFQPINHSLRKTFADRIIGRISWQFDFNYELTKQLYIKEGYQQMLFDLLAEYCPDKKAVDEIIKFSQL